MSKGEGPSDERLKHEANKQCDPELMLQLSNWMAENNPYAKTFNSMEQKIREEQENARQQNRVPLQFELKFIKKGTGLTDKVFCLPSANEIAAIGVPNDDDTFSEAAYSTFPINGKLQNLKLTDPNRDSMIFPLLFPYGVQGWTNGMPKITQIIYNNQNLDLNKMDNDDQDEDNDNEDLDIPAQDIQKHFVSLSEYYRFRLAAREGFSALHSSGKLFQEYILYAAISIISARLNWVQTHQKQLRVESYKGLRDYVDTIAQKENCLSGDKIILPASFEGGERSLSEHYHDSMTIMNFKGMADLFVTFTTNIHWKEITDLIGKIDPSDRPDIVCRVFLIKLKALMQDILHRHIFGVVIAYIYRIEFQKRGIPHAHILLTLRKEDKMRSPSDIDKYICAEIPNNCDSELKDLISRLMIHG
ncbi:MAG: putative ATP-dependent DNA helicase PIF1, partial [Streblomastix strix]